MFRTASSSWFIGLIFLFGGGFCPREPKDPFALPSASDIDDELGGSPSVCRDNDDPTVESFISFIVPSPYAASTDMILIF